MLIGLGSDYDALVTLMFTRSDLINLNNLYAHLLSYKLCVEHNNSALQINTSANTVGRSNSNNRRDRHSGLPKRDAALATHRLAVAPALKEAAPAGQPVKYVVSKDMMPFVIFIILTTLTSLRIIVLPRWRRHLTRLTGTGTLTLEQ